MSSEKINYVIDLKKIIKADFNFDRKQIKELDTAGTTFPNIEGNVIVEVSVALFTSKLLVIEL